jgi:coenzyme F420-dependent glucose-6-phosphate dehydrogenase
MGPLQAIRGVMWARKHAPDQPAYGVSLAHERFRPDELLDQAVAAEEAGFDAIACSDHLAPWWADGEPAPNNSGNAWVWLGAVGHATREAALGTAVTGAIHRYNPVVLAQQVATLEILNPGRAFLGVGSSEAMNEIPAGLDWPSVAEQQERMSEQLEIVTRLLDGDSVDFKGRYFQTTGARLYSLPERRPPVYVSAFGEDAARIAARYGDGLWTLADPMQAPKVIGAYRETREELGKEPGEIILQALFSWAEDDETAFESAREWKATLPNEHYTDPIHEPAEIQAAGEGVSDTMFKAGALIGSDPSSHVRKIKAIGRLGATAIILMNVSAADPIDALRVYGEDVLPELRG